MSLIRKDGDHLVFIAGKYNGSTVEEVAESDPSYIQWVYSDVDLPESVTKELESVCEEHNIDL